MLGRGRNRLYNIIALVFVGLSALFALYVVFRLIGG